jgi:hypothetical protein
MVPISPIRMPAMMAPIPGIEQRSFCSAGSPVVLMSCRQTLERRLQRLLRNFQGLHECFFLWQSEFQALLHELQHHSCWRRPTLNYPAWPPMCSEFPAYSCCELWSKAKPLPQRWHSWPKGGCAIRSRIWNWPWKARSRNSIISCCSCNWDRLQAVEKDLDKREQRLQEKLQPGVDMSVFASVSQLASWAGISGRRSDLDTLTTPCRETGPRVC